MNFDWDDSVSRIVSALREHSDFVQQQSVTLPRHNLSMAQFRTLLILALHEPMTVTQLARELQVGAPTSSHLVEKLVQVDLAERVTDTADRRRTFVRLTDRGKATARVMRQGSTDPVPNYLRLMTEEDVHALLRGLEALIEVERQERLKRYPY